MTTKQLIDYLRSSVHISEPSVEEDSAYLSMTDEDILLYLNVVMTRDYPDTPSLDAMENSSVYPITLLAKKELYYTLAVKEAPFFDLGADNNNYLKRDQRFQHYMKLIEQVDKEYQDYLDNGGGLSEDGAGNTLTSFEVLLSNRYYTSRYYEKGASPAPILYIDRVTEYFVELHWKPKVRKFAWCNVYLSTEKIVDTYLLGRSKIVDKNTLVQRINNPRQVSLRLEGLKPSTAYHIAIEVVDMSSLVGYSEVAFTTEDPEDGEEP